MIERRLQAAHFVKHDAKRPAIRLAVIFRPNEHLGRLVGRIVGLAYFLFAPDHARPLEISDLDIALLVKENFLGVEHAVNDALIVQVLQDQGNLNEVLPLLLIGHDLFLFLKLLNPLL